MFFAGDKSEASAIYTLEATGTIIPCRLMTKDGETFRSVFEFSIYCTPDWIMGFKNN